jgi:hypothetical protein
MNSYEELRNFYVLEERRRERRRILVVVVAWILLAGGIAALCWTGLQPQAFK